MNVLETAIQKIQPPYDTAVELTPEEAQVLYEYLIHQINGVGRWVKRTQSMSDYRVNPTNTRR